MRILCLDPPGLGLSFALNCQQAGHEVIMAVGLDRDGLVDDTGEGLVPRTRNWEAKMRWSDLIVMTYSKSWEADLEPYFKKGFPIFGPSIAAARLERDRTYGQKMLNTCGVDTIPFCEFRKYEEASAFVSKTKKRFVSKPFGDKDKALSYVAKNSDDMLHMLDRWRKTAPCKDGFMLQDFVEGIEFAVGCFFGPSGWIGPWCESFEHKKLLPGDMGPNCYPEDSEVLTKDGWKYWPDVTEDDLVCTLKEGKIEFEKPSQLVSGECSELIGWQSPLVDILVTPGHNMYVQDDHSRKEFWFEPAAVTENEKRNILRGAGTWEGADDISQLPNFYKGGFKEWCALLGAHIADGYCKERSIIFGNCPPHKQSIFSSIAESAGYRANMYGNHLYINGKELTDHFRIFGKAIDKFVPQYIKDASKEAIEVFLYGYGTGDGTFKQNNLCYTTISKKLADDLQELCLKVGWCANVIVRDRRGETHTINGYTCYNRHVAYDVRVSRERPKAGLTPEMSYRQPYNGKVYCCTVTSHIIYVRRNGKACFSGQTGETGTVMKFVKESYLADCVLAPCEGILHGLNYVGYVDLNCIIDAKGRAWPLEWTIRLGWPLFNLQDRMNLGDPAKWMLDAINGKDTINVSRDHCTGLVVCIPDFPYSHLTKKHTHEIPVYGITKENRESIHPDQIQAGTGPVDGKWVSLYVTAGDQVCTITGTGKSVAAATKRAYETAKEIHIPNNMFYRDDIGEKVKENLPKLQKMGFALEWKAE